MVCQYWNSSSDFQLYWMRSAVAKVNLLVKLTSIVFSSNYTTPKTNMLMGLYKDLIDR